MQQRRGLAAQWTAANPVLAAGEIGFETDTSKFKMGNGTSTWSQLVYFANATELQEAIESVVGMSPEALDTLAEISAALGDDPDFLSALVTNTQFDAATITAASSLQNLSDSVFTAITTHGDKTTGVHGIADTAALALTATVASDIATAVSTHNSITTNVHGIANTALLATLLNVSDAVTQAGEITDSKITDYNTETENVHGIMDTADLAVLDDIVEHNLETQGVHGIMDTADLALQSDVSDAISSHHAETMNVHGIANTALLATTANVLTAKGEAIDAATVASGLYTDAAVEALTKNSVGLTNVDNTADLDKPVSTAQATAIEAAKTDATQDAADAADTKVSDHNSETENVHGIADTTVLVTQTDLSNAILGVTIDMSAFAGQGLEWNSANEQFDVDDTIATEAYADGAVSDHNLETENVHGIADTAELAYKNAANQTFTGNLEVEGNIVVEGNLTISGTTTTVNAADLSIQDPLIYLASNQYTQDTLDVGFLAATGAPGGTEESHLHSGFFRDASDSKKWKLVSNVPHPVNNVVDVTNATRETLVVGALEATTVTPSSGIVFSDGTQTKLGVPSVTTFATEITSSATLAAGEADKFVPLNGAVTITLPSTGYSTGQSIDFYQATGTGAQFSDANGVVGTPGRKFRTTNSVVTAMKTAAGWLVFGDLSL